MTWRDELRPASFRGAPFLVERARTTQGQHADEHEFPGREQPERSIAVRHLGAGPRRYRIEAFVVGDDYMDRRDALEAELAKPGSGRLVHPYRGERTVAVVGRIETVESKQRNGYAKIVFEVVDVSEAGLRRRADAAAIADRDLDSFLEDTARDFDSEFSDTSSVLSSIDDSSSAFSDAQDALRQAHDAIAQVTGAVTSFEDRITDFAGELEDFIEAPGNAARALQGAIGAVMSIPGDLASAALSTLDAITGAAGAIVGAAESILGFTHTPERLAVTPDEIAADRRAVAVAQLVRATALAETARTVMALEYASRTRATETREAIDDLWDDLVESSTAAGTTVSGALLFETLRTARTSTFRRLSVVAAELPDVRTHEVPIAQPALVLAHELYGDPDREEDLLARNDISDPFRIPAGELLEVLRA